MTKSGSELPPIEEWWPQLSIEGKHELQENVTAQLSETLLSEIEAVVSISLPGRNHKLTEDDRRFIETQGEAVD